MSNIFAKIRFEREPEKKEEPTPCLLALCDGSGLVEVACQYGYHFIKCLCREL